MLHFKQKIVILIFY